MPFKMHKIIFFPEKKNVCLPYLKFSSRYLKHTYFFYFTLASIKFLSTWLMVCFLFSSEQIEVGCDVLQKLLTALHPNIILHNFHSELLAGLQHPTSAVKKLCVTQVTCFFLFCYNLSYMPSCIFLPALKSDNC